MNKYLDKFIVLPMGQVALIALAIGVLYYFQYFDNGENLDTQVAQIKISISEEERKKKETEELLLEEENITKKANRLSEEIKEFNKKIPTQMRHSEMINYINALCRDFECRVLSTAPLASQTGEKDKYFEKMKLTIRLEGKYWKLVQLIYSLATGEKLYLVEGLRFRRLEEQKADSKIVMDGVLIAYKQLTTEGAAK